VSPVITQRDFNERLVAIYKTPQPYLDFDGAVKTRSSDAASLIPRGELVPESALQTRRIQTASGVVFDPQFHWPDYSGGGFVIIKTFPLAAWDHTTITGLTTSPLVLTDDFAQTYAPGHHNFTEVFLFEPALDPGITAEQRAELEAANIRMIHVFTIERLALAIPSACSGLMARFVCCHENVQRLTRRARRPTLMGHERSHRTPGRSAALSR
jgi:hypothetical protein